MNALTDAVIPKYDILVATLEEAIGDFVMYNNSHCTVTHMRNYVYHL